MHFVRYFDLLLVILSAIPVNTQDTSKKSDCRNVHGKIVGGKKVLIDDYPYQLSLQLNRYHICGATIIGNKWAVTAAHCTHRVPALNFTIRAGTSFRGYDGEVLQVQRIYEHPYFNIETLDCDLAVLELASPITTKKAAKVPMASWYNFLFPWLSGTVTGWGSTKENGLASWQLQVVNVPLVNYCKCSLVYGKMKTSNMFCAGERNKDSCQGDSGGPLVINGKLYGIVSFGIGCGKPNYPGVYTRISSFRSFIYGISGI